jgi:hypothetical protein
MPGEPDDTRDIFGSLLGRLFDGARDFAVATLPGCNTCGGTALPLPCEACGEYSCLDHAFINRGMRMVCSQCVEALEVDFDDGDEAQVADTDAERVDWAFSVLGLQKDSSEQDINKAFRELALKHHPDRGGDQQDFSRLQEAKEVAVKYATAGGE